VLFVTIIVTVTTTTNTIITIIIITTISPSPVTWAVGQVSQLLHPRLQELQLEVSTRMWGTLEWGPWGPNHPFVSGRALTLVAVELCDFRQGSSRPPSRRSDDPHRMCGCYLVPAAPSSPMLPAFLHLRTTRQRSLSSRFCSIWIRVQ
jgi:hypothetical protein